MEKLKILFLCMGNSCRSQMAEGWTRQLKSDVIEPYSAGIEPKRLDPFAVRVMAEAGVDISGQYSKHMDEWKDVAFDYVIMVCNSANERCPFFPGKTGRLHKSFDDPPRLAESAQSEKEIMEIYRRVRDEIKSFVANMPENLVPL